MDKDGFRKFLREKNLKDSSTIRLYVQSVARFEEWLYRDQPKKSFEDANARDIRNWSNIVKRTNYLSGVKKYYLSKHNQEMVTEIAKIIKGRPKEKPKQRLFDWKSFRDGMSKAEQKGINDRNRVLLNLLWSKMKSTEILDLHFSDIDFENKLIIPFDSEEKYRITQEAWDAIDKYVSIGDRDKSGKLFSIKERALAIITKKYFGGVNQKPNTLRESCKEDVVNLGEITRFVMETQQRTISQVPPESTKKRTKTLFDKLVQEIENFGSKMPERIQQIKEEKDFRLMLLGYLLATFSDEIITPEFYFKGDEEDSIIDFAIGRDQKIPIEVKLVRPKEKLRDYLSQGSGQANEFLKSHGSKKGILVIGDQKRDPERRKHSGLHDNVYIIVV